MPLEPSDWVVDHLEHIKPGGHILDLACGKGRHSRLLLQRGFRVTAVDIDVSGLQDIQTEKNLVIIEADLENGSDWPVAEQFDGIIVTNYLHRPLFDRLLDSLAPGGVLIVETFMTGNERFGKPAKPDFLLNENELLDAFGKHLTILEFSQGYQAKPKPAIMQMVCGIKASK